MGKITLNDLGSIKNIINVASRRGAFGAEEFIDIGTVYGKLEKFLQVQVKILEEKVKVEEEKIEQITLNDLASLRNVINVASRRGAFGVEEFVDIGKIFTKLDVFLKEQTKLLE